MKRIVFYLAGLDNNGGAERVVSNLSNYYSQRYEVMIITTGFSKTRYKLNTEIRCYSLDNNVDKSKDCRLFKNIKRIFRLKQIIKKLHPDVIITFLPNEIYRILFLRKVFIKLPVIISLRDDPATEYKTKLREKLMSYLIKYADGIVFQTEEAAQFFKGDLIKDFTVIPNPINEEFLGKSFSGKREKVIVTVGRLVPQKNHELLIDALYNVSKKHKDYRLYIFGEGYLKDNLEAKIKQLGLDTKVFLKGNSNDIIQEISRTSLFVLSSNHEGMPNALIEAMALGLPVISTDCPCGGPRFLIENSVNGLLTEVGNKQELEGAIDNVLSNDIFSKMIGKNAKDICSRLEPSKIYGTWENYINKICKSCSKE